MARKRFNFWLNDKRQDDWLVNDIIDKLKAPGRAKGQFTRAIREGLRLWDSLREGRVDVLLELFPFVEDEICKRQPPDDSLKNQLDRLEQLMLQQGNLPAPPPNYPAMKPVDYMPSIPLPAPPKAQPTKSASTVSASAITANMLDMFD